MVGVERGIEHHLAFGLGLFFYPLGIDFDGRETSAQDEEPKKPTGQPHDQLETPEPTPEIIFHGISASNRP
jgi:hypothetical protein